MAAIKVWVKQPRELGKVQWVHDDLESLQALVDGPIEVVRLKDPRYCLLVNEEGMLRGDMVLNLIMGMTFIFGPVVVIGLRETEDGLEFCSCDLNAKQVRSLILKEGAF